MASSASILAQDRYRNEGIYNITQYAFGSNYDVVHRSIYKGYSSNASNSFFHEIQTEFGGYIIKKHLTWGAGIGFARYFNPDITTMPVFTTMRLFVNKVDNSPYFMVRANGSILVRNRFKIQTGIKTGVGYKLFIDKKCYTVEMNYQRHGISMDLNNISLSSDKYYMNSFVISLGVMPF